MIKVSGLWSAAIALGLAGGATHALAQTNSAPPPAASAANQAVLPPAVSLSALNLPSPPPQAPPVQPASLNQVLAPPASGAPAAPVAADDLSQIQDEALRSRVEKLSNERLATVRPAQLLSSEPWLSPTGEQYAGVVGNRTLTLTQLKQRAAAMLAQAPPIDDGSLPSDQVAEMTKTREAAYEGNILSAWIENTALSVYAEKRGIQATDAEVQKAYEDLSQHAAGGAAAATGGAGLLMNEKDLRQELRDGLLAEKAVRRGIEEIVTEDKLRQIYAQRPDLFVLPSRVKAWQIFLPVIHFLSPKEEKDVISKMNGWRKKLARAKTDADFKALQKELGSSDGLIQRDAALVQLQEARDKASAGQAPDAMAIRQAGMQAAALGDPDKPVISDLGWVAEGDPMPAALQEQLFKLDAGDTSDVFKSDSGNHSLGYNVVKVLERVKGEQGTFEQARPRIENMVYDQVKDLVYQTARASVEIQSDRTGLRKWRKIDPTPTPVPTYVAPAIAVPEPNLSGLRNPSNLSPAEAALLAPLPAVKDVVKSPATPRRQGIEPTAGRPELPQEPLPPIPPPQAITRGPQP